MVRSHALARSLADSMRSLLSRERMEIITVLFTAGQLGTPSGRKHTEEVRKSVLGPGSDRVRHTALFDGYSLSATCAACLKSVHSPTCYVKNPSLSRSGNVAPYSSSRVKGHLLSA